MYLSCNPFTQIVDKSYAIISNNEVDEKIALSKVAFDNWKSNCLHSREKLLNRIADLLEERSAEYGRLITIEMGKPITQAIAEVEKCAWACRYFAQNGSNYLQNKTIKSTAQISQLIYEPLGTILGIMPWNFPFWQIFRFVAPNLMAGNAILLKHASNVPQCALAIEKVIIDAGAPQGLVQNLFVDYRQIENIVASSPIKGVTFTGSEKAGRIIASMAGKHLKKCVLELGGSDPFIVFEDANLNAVLENAMMSRFLNAGQSCIAAKRILVHQNIANEFLSNFQSLIENLKLGDPLDAKTFIGPLVNQTALNELHAQVAKTIKLGATCLLGGAQSNLFSGIYLPTLLINIPYNSPIWQQEVFGPIAVIEVFETDDQAIEMANDTLFGLGASVWTEDLDRADAICKSLNVGMVAINSMVKSEPALPFGGVNNSGFGRELGEQGILEFMSVKTISYFNA